MLQLLILLGMSSCKKDEVFINDNTSSKQEVKLNPEGKVVLGKKLKNAYSVENMQKAYETLKKQNRLKSISSDEISIKANCLYVRFLPKDSTDLNTLWNDTTLELFDYPLDYEIVEDGYYYQDPNIPEGKPTWQYTVVPIDYEFPEVEHEIIEECFIPDEDSEEIKLKSTSYKNLLASIEYESMKLTDNLTDEEKKEQAKLKGWGWLPSKGNPKGYIQVNNTNSGLERVMRIKVRTHRIVNISSTYTNESGYYKIPRGYRYNVHYALIFENATGFKIWGNWAFLAPARYNMGWHSKNGLNRDIYKNSGAWKWATVNNAVHKYCDYCNTFSISKPPSNLRLWVRDKSSGTVSGSAAMLRRTWGFYGFHTTSKLNTFFNYVSGINISTTILGNLVKFVAPDITISVNSGNVGTDDVYNTVFHECGHASHWTKVGSSYWVKYINYIITYGSKDNPYGNGTGHNAGYCGVGEMWGNYIGAMLERREFSRTNWNDLNHGEDWYNPGFLRHVDDITDVTTSEIFSCMTSGTNTIDKMVSKLKTKTINDEEVDDAYDLYTDWP